MSLCCRCGSDIAWPQKKKCLGPFWRGMRRRRRKSSYRRYSGAPISKAGWSSGPASSALSWRRVAGLHTKGKAYQARVPNIAEYSDGLFRPDCQLVGEIEPLSKEVVHPRWPLPSADPVPNGPFLLLATEEDGCLETLSPRHAAVLGLLAMDARSPMKVSLLVQHFATGVVADAMARAGADSQPDAAGDWGVPIIAATSAAGTKAVVTAYAPVAPVASLCPRRSATGA